MPIVSHQLREAEYLPSPNCDERPFPEISLIVIHGISLPAGQYGGPEVEQLFTNKLDTSSRKLRDLAGVRVSSHLFIRRDGSVVQFVPFDQRAWHAGESRFVERERCNDFSIGIELEGTDAAAYELAQYQSLTEVCVQLMHYYGIRDVVGHCHIAPGRKTDPGDAFDWWRLRRGLATSL